MLQFISTRPLLRSVIAFALGELAARVHPEVEAELERRGVDAARATDARATAP